jgi:DNA gyrase/topoisomerase IV subunit B
MKELLDAGHVYIAQPPLNKKTQGKKIVYAYSDEQMAKITLRDGTSFTCNTSHVLSLVNNDHEGRWGLQQNQIVDVTVAEYLKWSDKRKHLSKMFKR